jgi:hypothetical protein
VGVGQAQSRPPAALSPISLQQGSQDGEVAEVQIGDVSDEMDATPNNRLIELSGIAGRSTTDRAHRPVITEQLW